MLIDTHAHLDFPDFAADLPEVIARAVAAGVGRMVAIGCDLESSRRAVALAERFPEVYAAVGWHPGYVEQAPEDVRPGLEGLVGHPRVVAIGECGVDHYRLPGTAEDARIQARQRAVFGQQLALAAEAGLPCVVHQREAFAEALALVEPWAGKVRTVFHCFVGTPVEAAAVVRLGSLVSFTGILTFKNAGAVRETLAAVPAGSFLLETDCPYLAPVPHRGKRCEPAYVADLARVAAAVRGVEVEQLAAETTATAAAFFPADRWAAAG